MEVKEASVAVQVEHHEMTSVAAQQAEGLPHSSFISKSCLYGQIAVTCALLVVGGVFVGMCIEKENYYTAFVAFIAATSSAVTLCLFLMDLLGKLEKYHNGRTLKKLKLLGFIMCSLSAMSLGASMMIAIITKQAFSLSKENYASAAVFSGMGIVCSFQLYMVAIWYQESITAKEPEPVEATSSGNLPF